MKCLEKDRTRRYETANGLAADIQRHLDDEPVDGRPAERGLQAPEVRAPQPRQGARRGLVAGALMLGVIGTTAGMICALDEKERADGEAKQGEAGRRVGSRGEGRGAAE